MPHLSLPSLTLMPDGLNLQLHRHSGKRQSGHTQSGPNRPMARNAVSQSLNEELPLVVDIELVAAEEIYLLFRQITSLHRTGQKPRLHPPNRGNQQLEELCQRSRKRS